MEEVIMVTDCGEKIGDYDIPIHNAIIVPENATNGDMIEATFNPYKVCEYKYSVLVYMTEKDFQKADYQMNCDASWWNAPLKTKGEE